MIAPRFHAGDKFRIALAQVFMCDPAGAQHVVVGERDRIEVHLAVDRFIPIEAAAGCVLELG
ncbi:hypothetical protein D3C86_2259450 [compost metagenome]